MNPAKLESREEEEAEQRLKPEAVKETGTTQSGAGPAKRKREVDENDGVEAPEKWGYCRKDITDDEEDVETDFPMVTIILNVTAGLRKPQQLNIDQASDTPATSTAREKEAEEAERRTGRLHDTLCHYHEAGKRRV